MGDCTVLMCKDKEVIKYNYSNKLLFLIVRPDLVPYQLRGRVYQIDESMFESLDIPKITKLCMLNDVSMQNFLANRALSIGRENSKCILNLLNCDQRQADCSRSKVALLCNAVSLEDNYWVKPKGSDLEWKDVNLRHNNLNKVIAQVALHGSCLILKGDLLTPELTTDGAYAKCWKRQDGDLWLYKRGFRGDMESHIEVEVSGILDKMVVSHVQYLDAESMGVYCCKCRCMTTEAVSRLTAVDFAGYCSRNGLNFMTEILKIDAVGVYKMCIVDYLISNRDRHGGNWGFLYDSSNMKILGCHPLFDHNNAFDIDTMGDITGGESQVFLGKTKLDVARMALKRVRVDVSGVKCRDFLNRTHYKSFMARCKMLGLK